MADIQNLILDSLKEIKTDLRDHMDDTSRKFDTVINVQQIHNDFMVEQKTSQGIFKWVASVGGLSGLAAFLKSFSN